MNTPDNPGRTPHHWSELNEVEVEILGQLCSPEAVDAFAMMHRSIRLDTAPQFVDLLRTINALSGSGFADRASSELLDAVTSTGEIGLLDAHIGSVDDPISVLALAQLIRTIAAHRPALGDAFGR